jgi:transposase
MHVRISRVNRNGRTYEYAQLVESFRRPSDGMPMHRVISTLGEATALEVHNLREALAAARKGKRVALVRVARPSDSSVPKPTANLRYLDLAVLLELWRGWGLDELLDALMPVGAERLRPAAVVAALSLQRCVDPGSTLYAARWLPRTALVELLGLDPHSFNNTRLHRVLDDLDAATLALMSKLARRYEQRDGAFVSMFLDVSDAWFTGRGPTLAKYGKTKEGLIRHKIGVVLLCNEHGFPLRWEVIAGNQSDSVAMGDMLRAIAGLSWVGEAPVVCDRAMGKTAYLVEMLATKLRFLTALTVTEFDAYASTLPHEPFAALDPRGEAERSREVEQAVKAAEQTLMTKVDDDLFVLDLGVVERADVPPRPRSDPTADAEDVTVAAMRLCRQIRQGVTEGRFASYAAAGRAAGLSKSLTSKYIHLGRLSEQQQREILEGKAKGCTLAELLQVAAEPDADARERAFAARLTKADGKPQRARARRAEHAGDQAPGPAPQDPVRVRVVVSFNPDRFVEQRVRAHQQLQRVEAFVKKLNTKLGSPRAKRSTARIAATVDRELRKGALLEAFDVHVDEQPTKGRPRYRVELRLKQTEWALRRRYDGFTVLVAHPSVSQSAVDLCRLYRAKDAVEKDFQIIKSVVELRPIWHRTDTKVRAHVTLCMLALLLERTLQRKLTGRYTAEAAIELLASCQLNLYAGKQGAPAYAITHPDDDQKTILHALRLQHLIDDQELADRITPRCLPPHTADPS